MLIFLKILLLIILFILFSIALLLILILLIPFRLNAKLKKDQEFQGSIEVSWLFGILGINFSFYANNKYLFLKIFTAKIAAFKLKTRSAEEKKEKALKKAEKKRKKKVKKKQRHRPTGKQTGIINTAIESLSLGLPNEITALISRLFSSLKLKIFGHLEYGFSDPANTGMLYGFFSTLNGAFSNHNFTLNPNWEKSIFKGYFALYCRIWLAGIIWIAARFIFSKPVRKIWWPTVKNKMSFRTKAKPKVA